MRVDALRIMAPGAVQVAAFKEDRGSDARPILGAESLDLHDVACHGVLLMESVFYTSQRSIEDSSI